MDVETFWNNAKSLMKSKNMTQEDVADLCGFNLGTFRGWITRKILPDAISSYKIAETLNTTVEYLVTGEYRKTDNSLDGIYKQKYESLLRAMIPILDAARADCENL